MKIKNVVKKIMSVTLMTSMLFTSITSTAYADHTNDELSSNAQGNNGSSAATAPGGDFGVDNPPRIGLRFSVINGDPGHTGEVISDNIIDYWFMNEAEYKNAAFHYATSYTSPGGGYYAAIKTQTIDNENRGKLITIMKDDSVYDKFPLQESNYDWAHHDGVRYWSDGKDYVDWLNTDKYGNQSGINDYSFIKGYVNAKSFRVEPNTDNAEGAANAGKYSVAVNNVSGNDWKVVLQTIDNGHVRVGLDSTYTGDYQKTSNALFEYWNNPSNGVKSYIPLETIGMILGGLVSVDRNMDAAERQAAMEYIETKFSSRAASFTYQQLGAQAGFAETYIADKDKEEDTKEKEDIKEKEVKGNTGTVDTIEEVDEAYFTDRSPIFKILNYVAPGDNRPLLATPGLEMKKYKVRKPDGSIVEEEHADWFGNKDHWILLVEPLFMLTIMNSSGNVIVPKQVGTITNLAQALGASPKASKTAAYKGTSGWMNYKAINQALWCAFSVNYGIESGETLSVRDKNTGVELYTLKNPFYLPVVPASTPRSFESMNRDPIHEGYGVCMWWAGNLLGEQRKPDLPCKITIGNNKGTHTFDSAKYGTGNSSSGKYEKGPAPEPTAEEKEEGESKSNNIVKFYANKAGNNYVYTDNNVRKDTISPIQIEDEEGYKVDGWFTSETFKDPTGNKSESFDAYKSSLHNKKVGDRIDLVSLDNNDTLYLRLVNTDYNIISFYEDTSGKTVKGRVDQLNVPRDTIVSTDGLKEWKITKEPPTNALKFNETPSGRSGSGTPPAPNADENTLYLLYEIDDNVIKLHQDELAHTYKMSDLRGLVHTVHKFASRWKVGYHHEYCSNCGEDHIVCISIRVPDEENYNFDIVNKANYGNTNFIGDLGQFKSTEVGDVKDNTSTRGTSIYSFSTKGSTPNLRFTLYRDKVKDLVTLYPDRGSRQNNSDLSNLGIKDKSFTDLGHRSKSTGTDSWKSTFFTDYQYEHLDKRITAQPSLTCHDGSPYPGPADGTPTIKLSEINSLFSKNGNVMTKAFFGEVNKGDAKHALTASAFNALGITFDKHDNVRGTQSDDSVKYIEFYPYIKMYYQYNSEYDNSSSGNHVAYVTSTNTSSISKNAFVEVGIHRDNASGENSGYGIGLQSEQWSTHARTMTGLKNNGVSASLVNHSLIPGGAIVTLTDGNTDSTVPKTYVGFRAYEMSIPDDLKESLSDTNMVTTSEAKQNGVNFYNQVQSVLKGYQLEKWIGVNVSTDKGYLDTNGTKVSGINPASTFDGNTLQNQSNSKYYLKTADTGANGAQFDLKNQRMEQHVYKIWADITSSSLKDEGMTINISKDGTILVSSKLKADKNKSGLLANSEVAYVNARTCFVDNFVEALDMGLGSDRNDKAWYYECQDGIEVVETQATMQLTLGDGSGNDQKRSDVIDPKLAGKLDDHGDILSFEDGKARTVQYMMSSHSLTSDASGKADGYVGTFDGMDIIIPNITKVMRSRLHYMSNNTVMDLN